MFIPIGALVALALGIALLLLVRTFFVSCLSYAEATERVDLSWKDYRPLHCLLDAADFDYLRERGISEDRIHKLRKERRKIYRLCLRSLARDFNTVHRAVSLVLIQSRVDRPDLMAELAKQRVAFYRNLLRVEFRLTLHAFGIEPVPAIDLLQPLQILQAQLGRL